MQVAYCAIWVDGREGKVALGIRLDGDRGKRMRDWHTYFRCGVCQTIERC